MLFTPWTEGRRSRCSSWSRHTFFKFSEEEAVTATSKELFVLISPTYGWGHPSQCTQEGWLVPPTFSHAMPLLHPSHDHFHAVVPSQWSLLQRGFQLRSPQQRFLPWEIHLLIGHQGQHSGGPKQFWGFKFAFGKTPRLVEVYRIVFRIQSQPVPSKT